MTEFTDEALAASETLKGWGMKPEEVDAMTDEQLLQTVKDVEEASEALKGDY